MSDKIYLDANNLLNDSFLLARKIYDSGFKPDCIIALWRGGTPVGIAVHEFLLRKGLKCKHTAVKTASYTGIATHGDVVIEIDHVLDSLAPGAKVLVVDDIFDTGRTAAAVKQALSRRTSAVKFAMVYYKPARNETTLTPDFFIHITDTWLVFPHEIIGLTNDEVLEKSGILHNLLDLEVQEFRSQEVQNPQHTSQTS